jgi:hypothetical protein
MADTLKRIHLSTAVTLMLLGSILLFINLRERVISAGHSEHVTIESEIYVSTARGFNMGFPLFIFNRPCVEVRLEKLSDGTKVVLDTVYSDIVHWRILANLSISVLILLAFAYVLERSFGRSGDCKSS